MPTKTKKQINKTSATAIYIISIIMIIVSAIIMIFYWPSIFNFIFNNHSNETANSYVTCIRIINSISGIILPILGVVTAILMCCKKYLLKVLSVIFVILFAIFVIGEVAFSYNVYQWVGCDTQACIDGSSWAILGSSLGLVAVATVATILVICLLRSDAKR